MLAGHVSDAGPVHPHGVSATAIANQLGGSRDPIHLVHTQGSTGLVFVQEGVPIDALMQLNARVEDAEGAARGTLRALEVTAHCMPPVRAVVLRVADGGLGVVAHPGAHDGHGPVRPRLALLDADGTAGAALLRPDG